MGIKKMHRRVKAIYERVIRTPLFFAGKILVRSKNTDPIAIIMVDGGFCSVMTKYVLGKCMESQLGISVKYDLSWFEVNGMDCDGVFSRDFQLLKVFPELDMPVASSQEIAFYKRYFYYTNPTPYQYNSHLFRKKRPIYVDGYFEHWLYFDMVKEQILKDFSFAEYPLDSQNLSMLEHIKASKTSVAIHVRRGDFINLGLCILTPDYYVAAIKHLCSILEPELPDLFFFSNDVEWVKTHIAGLLPDAINMVFVDINNNDTGFLDLMLIAECQHQISSNSSFGYWGGLLNKNKNKVVIIPDLWAPRPKRKPDKFLMGSDQAHCVTGWTIFSCENHQPVETKNHENNEHALS